MLLPLIIRVRDVRAGIATLRKQLLLRRRKVTSSHVSALCTGSRIVYVAGRTTGEALLLTSIYPVSTDRDLTSGVVSRAPAVISGAVKDLMKKRGRETLTVATSRLHRQFGVNRNHIGAHGRCMGAIVGLGVGITIKDDALCYERRLSAEPQIRRQASALAVIKNLFESICKGADTNAVSKPYPLGAQLPFPSQTPKQFCVRATGILKP